MKPVASTNAAPVGEMNTASESEMVILEQYLTAAQVASLSEADLNSALAIVYSGAGESEVRGELNALVN